MVKKLPVNLLILTDFLCVELKELSVPTICLVSLFTARKLFAILTRIQQDSCFPVISFFLCNFLRVKKSTEYIFC